MISGTLRPNAIALGEVSIDLRGNASSITATFAYVDTQTGRSHGSTTRVGPWSKEVGDALAALVIALERDTAAIVMTGTDGSTPAVPQGSPEDAAEGELWKTLQQAGL